MGGMTWPRQEPYTNRSARDIENFLLKPNWLQEAVVSAGGIVTVLFYKAFLIASIVDLASALYSF